MQTSSLSGNALRILQGKATRVLLENHSLVPSKIQCICRFVFVVVAVSLTQITRRSGYLLHNYFCVLQCSVTCGEKPGTRYRNVECVKVKPGKQEVAEEQEVVREQYCHSTPKPADLELCKVLPCTSWKHGSWGRVSI